MSDIRWIVDDINQKKFNIEKKAIERMSGFSSVEDFFEPSLDMLLDPYEMEDMEKVINLILSYIEKKKNICIYGDYDVDGISSVAILLKTFHKIGHKNISYYIPRRIEEGYGINLKAANHIVKKGVDLLITVDCGISSVEDIDYLNSKGVKVVVTDHHQCGEKLPNAYGILNPKKSTCTYPNDNLCGAGIAFKLACALLEKYAIKPMDELLEMATLATVADIVSLTGENRVIVKNGLKLLSNPQNKGIRALIEKSGYDFDNITSTAISFGLAPRINSTGRLNKPNIAVDLYMEGDIDRAREIAEKINQMNIKRQEIENEIYLEALEQVNIDEDTKFIVVYGRGWNSGVTGIVSSKITGKYHLPSAVIAVENDIGKASSRSIEGLNIYEMLTKNSELLEKYGGHEQAAGFTIKKENIQKFIREINKSVAREFEGKNLGRIERASSIVSSEDISMTSLQKEQLMEPFGQGNKTLSYVVQNVKIENPRAVGKDESHFKGHIRDEQNRRIDMISFNSWDRFSEVDYEKEVDVLFNMEANTYNGYTNIQMKVIDIKKNVDMKKYQKRLFKNIRFFFNNILDSDTTKTTLKDFLNVKSRDIANFEQNTLFLCYSYESYYNLMIILEYANIKWGMQNSSSDVYFMPLIDKIDLSRYEKIVLCDDMKKIEPKLQNNPLKKYMMDLSDYKFDYLNRENLAKYYVFIHKNQRKKIKIDEILSKAGINYAGIFFYPILLKVMGFIDIEYDFKYNKIEIKKITPVDKKNLMEIAIFVKTKEYLERF